jgi:hypothetical protein
LSQPNSNTKRSWGDHIIEWNPPPPPTPHKLLRHFQATQAEHCSMPNKGILEICVLEFKNIW